jgi:hypothetical protein
MQSPPSPYFPLSAPPAPSGAGAQGGPPPPAAGTRLPWPPPPGAAQAPNAPYGAAEPEMSDTVERMLRPQGLFQGMQPRLFDWQQAYAAPSQAASAPPGLPPAPGMAPDGAGYQAPGQYGQPPYPVGDYGATDYGAPDWGGPTYAPGQYPPGDFGNAQYPQGQYGQAQYPPGQYPPGQYPSGQFGPGGPGGPGGPYGPGGQFGPAAPPEDGGRRSLGIGKARLNLPKGPLVPAVVAATLVVIVVVAVVFVVQNNSPSNAGTGAGAGSSPTASSSASALAEAQAASQLSGLLAQSGNDRSDVNAAAGNVEQCKQLAPAAREFTKAATNRRALLSKLAQLPDRTALPSALVADITGAWRASAAVDEDLAKWASKAATGGCHKGNLNNPSYVASLNYDGIATADKTAFVGLWNPLARKDGQPTYTVDQL